MFIMNTQQQKVCFSVWYGTLTGQRLGVANMSFGSQFQTFGSASHNTRLVVSTVDDAALAAHRLAMCLADMGAWLKASRLRLNPTKTQLMWLGSQKMLARLDIDEMPVLSSTIPVQQSARDLAW